jgi:hypothetical protein
MENVMKTRDLITAAENISAEDRAAVVDSLLKTLDPPDAEIDQQWLAVAQQRLHTIENGKAELVASEQVFAKWQ